LPESAISCAIQLPTAGVRRAEPIFLGLVDDDAVLFRLREGLLVFVRELEHQEHLADIVKKPIHGHLIGLLVALAHGYYA
jgi:hypothetical protein